MEVKIGVFYSVNRLHMTDKYGVVRPHDARANGEAFVRGWKIDMFRACFSFKGYGNPIHVYPARTASVSVGRMKERKITLYSVRTRA